MFFVSDILVAGLLFFVVTATSSVCKPAQNNMTSWAFSVDPGWSYSCSSSAGVRMT